MKLLVDIKTAVSERNERNSAIYSREAPGKCETIDELKEYDAKLDDNQEYEKLVSIIPTLLVWFKTLYFF